MARKIQNSNPFSLYFYLCVNKVRKEKNATGINYSYPIEDRIDDETILNELVF